MSMMKIGISLSPHKSRFGPIVFAGDLNEGLNQARRFGYHGIEISLLDSRRIDKESLIRRLKDLNLEVFAIATGQTYYTDGYSLYHPDPDNRKIAIERLKGHVDLAAELNAKVIIGGIRGKIEDQESLNAASINEKGRAAIEQCVEYAESRQVILLLEPVNRYETNIVNTVAEGLELVKRVSSSNFKLLPDTFHMNIEEPSITESILLAGSDIGYIHFADSNRQAPGMGHVDFKAILSALKTANYKGPVGIEVLPRPDDEIAAKNAIQFMGMLNKINGCSEKGKEAPMG